MPASVTSSVGCECWRCKAQGRHGVVTDDNADRVCTACWREACNFGADDMDRMRVADARQNKGRFLARQGYMAKVEAGR